MKIISEFMGTQQRLRGSLESMVGEIDESAKRLIGTPSSLKQYLMVVYKSAIPIIDGVKLDKALELCFKYHKQELRDDGSPYITHPISVGYILAFMGTDIETISAGILHDVMESNIYRRAEAGDEIFSNCGPAVFQLVLNVTDIGKGDSVARKQQQARRIVQVSRQEDGKKTYAIKVADRIHNLLTLDGLKQRGTKSAAERKMNILVDTVENILHLARIVDKNYQNGTGFSSYHYLCDLARRNGLDPNSYKPPVASV